MALTIHWLTASRSSCGIYHVGNNSELGKKVNFGVHMGPQDIINNSIASGFLVTAYILFGACHIHGCGQCMQMPSLTPIVGRYDHRYCNCGIYVCVQTRHLVAICDINASWTCQDYRELSGYKANWFSFSQPCTWIYTHVACAFLFVYKMLY